MLDEFERGIDSYYAGQIPRGWENSKWDDAAVLKAARAPFVMGWYLASMEDNGLLD